VEAVFLAPWYRFTGPATNQGEASRLKEHSAEAIFARRNKRFGEEPSTAFAAFGSPLAAPGFSPQGGFYYQILRQERDLGLDTFSQLATEHQHRAGDRKAPANL